MYLYPAQNENVIVLTDLDTFSLAEKWNLGVDALCGDNCDVFLICNNDIIFNKHTIDRLCDRIENIRKTNENIGLVSAHNMRSSIESLEIIDYPYVNESNEAPGPDFSCFMVSKEAYDLVGPFDEDYSPCFFEDNDYHIRLIHAGLRAVSITAAPYYHFGSVTQNSVLGGICSHNDFERNRAYFKEKFGFIPGDPEYNDTVQSLET